MGYMSDKIALERDFGIHLSGCRGYWSEMANDAMPDFPEVTAANSGVPWNFTAYTDPKIIKVLITPMKSEEIYGTAKKGDWVTTTALFPVVELSGRSVSYADYGQNGDSDANANWINRQSFHFQTWTKWGEREVEMLGAGKIDAVNQKNLASISVLQKDANWINLFGIAGLELYGALNDPQLPPAIQPTPKVNTAGTATGSGEWTSMSDPLQVYADILKMFQQLTVQMGGNLDLETPIKLVIPTERQQCLLYANQYFAKTLREMLKETLPNMEIETLPEAGSSLSGGAMAACVAQLFVKEVEGQDSVTTAFTEKLRAHAVERYSSNTRQKKSQGSWGTLWFYPQACVTMTGI